MKTCIKCDVLLNDNNFSWYRAKNYIWKCNECVRAEKATQAKIKYKNNPEIGRAISLKSLHKTKEVSPIKYSCKQMLSSSKKRASALNKPHNITTDYLVSIAPKQCPVFGWELKYGGGQKSKQSPSLDKIDPRKGYTRDNVQIISLLANLMKNEATPEELKLFAQWVTK